jgi:hypothetical protein
MSELTTSPGTGATPPGKPALWRRTWVRVTAGIAVALVALIAIGSAANHPNAVAKAPAPPSTSAPAPAPSTPDPAPSTPAGPDVFQAGETETIGHGSTPIGTVTVGQAQVSTQPADVTYGERPANGYYVVAKVTVTADKSYTDGLDVYSGDFYALVKSQHFSEGDGNAFSGMTQVQESDSLSAGNLGAGETTTGYLAFDVPSPHGQIAFAPNSDGQPIAVWSY